MNEPRNDKEKISSIVTRAIDARTFSELQAFVKDLEGRPTDRLLRDTADLVMLSQSKAQIVSYVLATKFRHGDAAERRTILDSLCATSERLGPGEQRVRIDEIIKRLRAM